MCVWLCVCAVLRVCAHNGIDLLNSKPGEMMTVYTQAHMGIVAVTHTCYRGYWKSVNMFECACVCGTMCLLSLWLNDLDL